MKENHDRAMQRLIDSILSEGRRPRLLLHCCCAPCSTAVLSRLSECFDITVYFDNPNIDTAEEHALRARELESFVQQSGLAGGAVIIPYDPQSYYQAVRGLEKEKEGGARCTVCFRLRLDSAARYAKEKGFDYFTTTLTISPMKDAALLNQLGEEAAAKTGAVFLNSDFKKRGGYLLSTQLSKQYGIYRQDYCGCVFSRRERGQARAARENPAPPLAQGAESAEASQ